MNKEIIVFKLKIKGKVIKMFCHSYLLSLIEIFNGSLMLTPLDIYQGLKDQQVDQKPFGVFADVVDFNIRLIKTTCCSFCAFLWRILSLILKSDFIHCDFKCWAFFGQCFLDLIDDFLNTFRG